MGRECGPVFAQKQYSHQTVKADTYFSNRYKSAAECRYLCGKREKR